MKKEKKIGLTLVNWILSILGILLFASFIILPPVFRVVFKKEVKEPEPVEEIVIVNMTCTRNSYTVNDHLEDNVVKITYAKDSLLKYSKRTVQNFKNNTTAYEQEINKQGRLTAAYMLVDGVEYNVSPQVSELKIIVEENYDLDKFKEESVTSPDSEEVVEVKSEYKKGDSANGIISSLTSNGYNCQKDAQ